MTESVSLCGRRMTGKYEPISRVDDWTCKCRVCFVVVNPEFELTFLLVEVWHGAQIL